MDSNLIKGQVLSPKIKSTGKPLEEYNKMKKMQLELLKKQQIHIILGEGNSILFIEVLNISKGI